MEKPLGLKCECANCGNPINYVPDQAGTILECPQCKAKVPVPDSPLVLSAQQSLQMTSPAKHVPARTEIPKLSSLGFQQEESTRLKRRTVAGAIAVLTILLMGLAVMFVWQRIRTPSLQPTASPPAGLLPQPEVKKPRLFDDLRVGRFALATERGNPVRIITGDVQNISENFHLNLTIYLDVLDARGEKISEIRETILELAPKATWRVITRTENTNAISARFNRFGERF